MIHITIETDSSAEAAAVVAELHRIRLAAHLVPGRPNLADRQQSRRHLRPVGDP